MTKAGRWWVQGELACQVLLTQQRRGQYATALLHGRGRLWRRRNLRQLVEFGFVAQRMDGCRCLGGRTKEAYCSALLYKGRVDNMNVDELLVYLRACLRAASWRLLRKYQEMDTLDKVARMVAGRSTAID